MDEMVANIWARLGLTPVYNYLHEHWVVGALIAGLLGGLVSHHLRKKPAHHS